MRQLLKKGKLIWGHLFTITATEGKEQENLPPSINSALEEFEDVFQEPSTLPPQRQHDHFIPLKPETVPVSIRPYRYNYFQKNEIEKQIKEMLHNGIIQASHSPSHP